MEEQDPEEIVRDFVRNAKKAHSVLWAFDQLILQPHAALLKMLTEFDKIDIE